jgi:hypothetical protein
MPSAVHVHHRDLAIAYFKLELVVKIANRVSRPARVNVCANLRFVIDRRIRYTRKHAPAIEAMRALRWPIVANATGLRPGLRRRQDAT